jgi:hypothetical protein
MTTKEISGDEFVARQTRQIEREFKCSRPKPRNRAMGFKGNDRPKRFLFLPDVPVK